MTRICCRCARVEQGGRWLVKRPARVGREPLTHGYCPDCYQAMLVEIETRFADDRTGARLDRLQPTGSGACPACA
jgi:hypothetical protein